MLGISSVEFFPRPSSYLGDNEYFVIESDEYDTAYFEKVPKFHHYFINHLIITSLEYDHADIYRNVGEITGEFRKLVSEVDGNIFYNSNYPELNFLKDRGHSFSDILIPKEANNLIGEHNELNFKAAHLCLSKIIDEPIPGPFNFKLPARRQEFIGSINGAKYYDDFAHHPRAVGMVLDSFRKKYAEKSVRYF